jgi:hypothetical protein
MEITDEQLRAALAAVKIPVTPEALATLRAGLPFLKQGYDLNAARGSPKEMRTKIDALCAALSTGIALLEGEVGVRVGSGNFDGLWTSPAQRRILKYQRALLSRAERNLALFSTQQLARKRSPETGFYIQVFNLLIKLTPDRKHGVADPSYQFTRHCAALIGLDDIVADYDSYRITLNRWIHQRTEPKKKRK